MNRELLTHIRADQLDGSIFDASCHAVTVGPVTVEFRTSAEPPSSTAELYISRQLVGSCTVNAAHPSGKFGGSVGKLKAEVDLTLDVPGGKLDYKLTVCAPIIGGTSKSGTLGL
ncbi:Lipoprotein [Burkholderia pseudomallei]|uniref:hypothetical protein n=1 Tax=Burkholderia pseudomallei TaxID=28450 RepID=UPI00050F3234|nr:hypothetical protein [Burkholderia pseudomallei]KGC65732.1 hypothetical protein DP57_1578 [Burkholderia pseudomallei]OMW47673.1 hypothetical protein AQ808_22390 [Burkholderia pseudomallei]RAQ89622.1 hypothetical protein A4G86_24245 [Burkholderia pseudomallei]